MGAASTMRLIWIALIIAANVATAVLAQVQPAAPAVPGRDSVPIMMWVVPAHRAYKVIRSLVIMSM